MNTPPPAAPGELVADAVQAIQAAMDALAQASVFDGRILARTVAEMQEQSSAAGRALAVAVAQANAQIAAAYGALAIEARLRMAGQRWDQGWAAIRDLLADAKGSTVADPEQEMAMPDQILNTFGAGQAQPEDPEERAQRLHRAVDERPATPEDAICEVVGSAVAEALANGAFEDQLGRHGWRLVRVGDGSCPEAPVEWLHHGIDLTSPGWVDPIAELEELWRSAWQAGYDVGRAVSQS